MSQEEQMNHFVDAHILVEGGVAHRPSIEDKSSTVVPKSGFEGEWMYEDASE